MTRSAPAAVCLALLALGCRAKAPRHAVEELAMAGATVTDNALLGLTPGEVRERLVAALDGSGRFERVEGKRPDVPWSLTLEVPFTREAQKEGEGTTLAEVGATLVLERSGPRGPERYEVVGLGEASVGAGVPAQRREALRQALATALAQVVDAAALQLDALGRPDAALVTELSSADVRQREYALRVLTERRHPAAAPLLIERLQPGDLEGARRAIGALVEVRSREAVPALIELSRGRDPELLEEVLYALGDIGGDEAEAYLFTVAQGHDHPGVQAIARQALETMAGARRLERSRAPSAARPEVP